MHLVKDNILKLIGNTPLLQLESNIFAKAEFLNPGGSIKDRIGLAMIEEAEKRGELKPGMKIVEPTSGNTGIGLALVGKQKGYEVIIVMPENMSEERKKILKLLDAKLILTPKEENVDGAISKANEIRVQEKAFMPNQFKNLDNVNVHYSNTAEEIWKQTKGKVAAFVAGIGSGGTLAGVGKFLKEKNPNIYLSAVEPKGVSALLKQEPGLHQIQGIGDGFIPDILDTKIIDEVVEVSDEEALENTRILAKKYGVLVGTSSGANFFAAQKIAKKIEGNVITILADRAERYFSTALFED